MQIISFFSFKGGVGRTALLTNLGAHWAVAGKVVALMDLDLMAPGIGFSPLAGPHLYPEGEGLGMSDLLAQLLAQPDAEQLELYRPHQLLRELDLGSHADEESGRLFFLDAGTRSLQGLQRADGTLSPIPPQRGQPGEERGQRLYRTLARHLREDLGNWQIPSGRMEGRPFDLLLVDSRSGFAELADLSLGYLADRIVLVAGLNNQNLEGLRLTLQALQEQDRIPVDEVHRLVTLVFSPVPANEDEAVYRALEAGHRLLEQQRRTTASGEPERPPETFVLHYTPILATQESLLALEHPKGLYAQELARIARHLEGPALPEAVEERDELIQRVRQKTLSHGDRAAPAPKARTRPERSGQERANPLTNLPAWDWPLGDAGWEERQGRLDQLLKPNPRITMERAIFLNRLAGAIDLSAGERRARLRRFSDLTQRALEEQLVALGADQTKWESYATRRTRDFFATFHRGMLEWAEIVLDDREAVHARYLCDPVDGQRHPFPRAEGWAEYWFGLAARLLEAPRDWDRAERAIVRGADLASDAEDATETLVTWCAPYCDREALTRLETLIRRHLPPTPWLNLYLAEAHLERKPPGEAEAKALLQPLLQNPPRDAERCNRTFILIDNRLPSLVVGTEGLLRRAIELEPGQSAYQYNLGGLLSHHLARYEEAEAAYRKSIELDANPIDWIRV